MTQSNDQHARRVVIVAHVFVVALALALIASLARVAQLQFHPLPEVTQRIDHRDSVGRVMARRGALLDRQGRTLAASHVGYRLFADPKLIRDPIEFAVHVAHAVDIDPVQIDMALDDGFERRYVLLDKLLTDAQVAAARQLEMSGLALEPRLVRTYPQGPLAGQLIGFVGRDHTGLDGVEFAIDAVLRGQPGRLTVLRDVQRRALWVDAPAFQHPRDGAEVRLSIDTVIQAIAEEELAAACQQYEARSAQLIVMHATTGQLLAMANWPPFDPSGPDLGDVARRRNRCVTDPFEPGSIYKPFIHAAATAAGVVQPLEKIDTTTSGLWVTSRGRRLRDAHPHGLITWEQVLILSSNIGMGKIGLRLGERRLYQAVRAFGFGEVSGTALAGESRGIVNPIHQWTHYSLTSIPMGQEIAVTPVQLVRAFSAFANHGLIVSPSVIAAETDSPVRQRAIPPDVADATRLLLRRVVSEGTGRRAKSKHYQIWGKTGTAQVPDRVRGGYKPRAYTASFICGAPLDQPQIIVLVTVHEPNPSIGYYGGVVSAPVAKNVVERSLTYLGVPHDHVDPRDDASHHHAAHED